MKLTLVIFFTVFTFLGYAQNNESCEPIKKGKYFYYAPNGGVVTVIRKRKKQIERYNKEDQKFTFSITEIDSCSYVLELIKVKGVDKNQQAQILGKKINIDILSSDLDEYILFIAESNSVAKNHLILYKN